MERPEPFYRQAGHGPGLVCLHSNASASAQWRALMDDLAKDHHVIAPDLLGAGKTPAWPGERSATLADEVELIEPVLTLAGTPLNLVGHSYGAAVALKVALAGRHAVRKMALFEPTMFGLLEQAAPGKSAAKGIVDAATAAAACVTASDLHGAATCFIDYWMGPGSFAAMPAARQAVVAGSMTGVAGWRDALMTEPTCAEDLARLQMPVLLLRGGRSPASSLGVADLLARILPQVRVVEFSELGHMGPVTHPEVVNPVIADFLRST